jgi:hypothetical protein
MGVPLFLRHAWSLRSRWQEEAKRYKEKEGYEERQQEDAVQLWPVKTSQLTKRFMRV